jgi:hypothetical protein
MTLISLNPEIDDVAFPGMTHEVQVYEIDPRTKLSLHAPLFAQPHVSPLTPAPVSYQFKAKSQAEAVDRCQDMMARIARKEIAPDIIDDWKVFFRDAVDTSSPVVDVEHLRDQAAMGTTSGESNIFDGGGPEFKRLYEVREAMPKKEESKQMFSVLMVGALFGMCLTGAAGALAIGGSTEDIVYNLRTWTGRPFYNEAVMPNGDVFVSQMQAVPGYRNRYQLLSREKVVDGFNLNRFGEVRQISNAAIIGAVKHATSDMAIRVQRAVNNVTPVGSAHAAEESSPTDIERFFENLVHN